MFVHQVLIYTRSRWDVRISYKLCIVIAIVANLLQRIRQFYENTVKTRLFALTPKFNFDYCKPVNTCLINFCMFEFTHYQNADASVIKLLKSLSINIAPATIIDELEKHPEYPSLLAISDVLMALGIKNAAFRIGLDDLTKMSTPFIVHTHLHRDDFVVINKIEGDSVWVSSDKWSQHKITTESLKQTFAGIVLAVEPS